MGGCSCCGGGGKSCDIYKCAACGKTSTKAGNCCGKPMAKKVTNIIFELLRTDYYQRIKGINA